MHVARSLLRIWIHRQCAPYRGTVAHGEAPQQGRDQFFGFARCTHRARGWLSCLPFALLTCLFSLRRDGSEKHSVFFGSRWSWRFGDRGLCTVSGAGFPGGRFVSSRWFRSFSRWFRSWFRVRPPSVRFAVPVRCFRVRVQCQLFRSIVVCSSGPRRTPTWAGGRERRSPLSHPASSPRR